MMFVDLGWRLEGRPEMEGLGRLRQSVSTTTKGRAF